MARYVVLEFDDNEEAESFISVCTEKVVALVPKPTVFCETGGGCRPHSGRRVSGWVRGKKYGWWVCVACKKPSKQWGSSYNAVISSGKNFLEGSSVYPLEG